MEPSLTQESVTEDSAPRGQEAPARGQREAEESPGLARVGAVYRGASQGYTGAGLLSVESRAGPREGAGLHESPVGWAAPSGPVKSWFSI